MRILILCTLVLATSTTLTQTPIPRQGDSCPTGTHISGVYCNPFKSSEGDKIIQKSGKDCPTSYHPLEGKPKILWYQVG